MSDEQADADPQVGGTAGTDPYDVLVGRQLLGDLRHVARGAAPSGSR